MQWNTMNLSNIGSHCHSNSFPSIIIEEAHQLVNGWGQWLPRVLICTTHGFTAWHGGYGRQLLRKVDLSIEGWGGKLTHLSS